MTFTARRPRALVPPAPSIEKHPRGSRARAGTEAYSPAMSGAFPLWLEAAATATLGAAVAWMWLAPIRGVDADFTSGAAAADIRAEWEGVSKTQGGRVDRASFKTHCLKKHAAKLTPASSEVYMVHPGGRTAAAAATATAAIAAAAAAVIVVAFVAVVAATPPPHRHAAMVSHLHTSSLPRRPAPPSRRRSFWTVSSTRALA